MKLFNEKDVVKLDVAPAFSDIIINGIALFIFTVIIVLLVVVVWRLVKKARKKNEQKNIVGNDNSDKQRQNEKTHDPKDE